MATVAEFLGSIAGEAKSHFEESRSVLSFEQYLNLVSANPKNHLRNCAQYFSDMVDGFGHNEIVKPGRKLRRYKLFDASFAEGQGKIFGQEKVQHEILGHLKNFARLGRVDKLLLLHGPNGSAKTSIIQAIGRAAEAYSQTDEGALYHFSWIFPKKEALAGSLGFSKGQAEKIDSYAYLRGEAIDARIESEQRDHPLLLFSIKERAQIFQKIGIDRVKDEEEKLPDILRIGELSYKNRQIFDALMSSYHGDLAQVLRHVRVERFYFSRRYKNGISVVEPQISVDANMRQISADQSMLSLPGSLRHLSMFEISGPLVEANRGFIEYSDLLKRPIEAWKYLLVACEQAQVGVGSISLFFDLLMLATSNELHLVSFKEYPDWQSFKGRIELVRVPYLLDCQDEAGIYQHQLLKPLNNMHVAPHSIELAARWAVLTRLEPPTVQKYPQALQEIIRDLSPDEKLELYNFGTAPSRLSQAQARDLRGQIPALLNDCDNEAQYEGRFGASPREIRTTILHAAQDNRFDHLAVEAVFDQIGLLIEQKSSYEFLRREPVRGFRDAKYLLSSLRNHYRNILEDEVRTAVGLYSNESYLDLFTRYIQHVSAWTKNEKFKDPLIGVSAEADGKFMRSIESKLMASNEAVEDFRRLLITQIGAFKLENPRLDLDYRIIFSSHLKRLKEAVYAEQRDVVNRIIRTFLRLEESQNTVFEEKDKAHAVALKEGLFRLGYNQSSARCAMSFLLSKKDNIEEFSAHFEQPKLTLG